VDYRTWTSSIGKRIRFYDEQIEPACLTEKQREVFWRYACGQRQKVIAYEMGFCIKTCQAHITAIHMKIPGLLGNHAHYAELAMEILGNDSAKVHLLQQVRASKH
jgi:hypothetical protein